MNRNDDQLISKFMQANKHEVADNGFSRRVMRRLPNKAKVLSDILTAVCVVLSAILIYVYDGFNILLASVQDILRNQSLNLEETNLNSSTLLLMLAVFASLAIYQVYTAKE